MASDGVWPYGLLGGKHLASHPAIDADIYFPPLMWSLVPRSDSSQPGRMGPQITGHLPIVSDWIRYTKDRTSVDLRNLVKDDADIPAPGASWVQRLDRDAQL